jgi:hypothetical protein
MPASTVELDQPAEILLFERCSTDHDRRRAYALGMTRRKRENVRATSASAADVRDLDASMVEKLRGVVSDNGDAATRQPCRCSIAGSVEHNHANVKPVIDVLVRMTPEA